VQEICFALTVLRYVVAGNGIEILEVGKKIARVTRLAISPTLRR
jgi:hypothetical protein